MKVVREICVAGKVIDVTVKVPSGRHERNRAAKRKITSEKVQKNNDRMAGKKLTRLINANFSASDMHDTLTYQTEPSPEEAKDILQRFISRMRYAMKKLNKEFKWVIVTEYGGQRLHHHMITNAPLSLVREKWGCGHVLPRPLDDDPDYHKLGEYLIKHSTSLFREEDSPWGTRCSHSRNLIIPVPRIEEVDESNLWDDPSPWKGYYIDQDTVRRYEHPITGLQHLEYSMISMDDEPRIKKYYKGKLKRHEESYKRFINYSESQLGIDFYEEDTHDQR